MAEVTRCSGYCGSMCGYNRDCCNVSGSFVNHHHHHSHFNSHLCNTGSGVPGNWGNGVQDMEGMQLYHRVMSNTYKAERDLKERERQLKAGVTGIPFSHKTSVQGNPMRSGNWKSSSKFHKFCTKED